MRGRYGHDGRRDGCAMDNGAVFSGLDRSVDHTLDGHDRHDIGTTGGRLPGGSNAHELVLPRLPVYPSTSNPCGGILHRRSGVMCTQRHEAVANRRLSMILWLCSATSNPQPPI